MNRSRRLFEFEGFRADLDSRLLTRGERPVPLTPKAFDTLAALLERHGEVVEKDRLLALVWPDTFVEEATLAQNVYTLRKVLAEAGATRTWLETVPRRGYRLAAVVREIPAEPLSSARVSSLAVLPFAPLGGDAEDVYLGLGLADALIARLSNLGGLAVRPTSAVRRWLAPERDPAAAGRTLVVDAVLDGTLQRAGDVVRLSVQLLAARDGALLWAGRFDAPAAGLFELEDSLSQRLAAELELRLSHQERDRLARRATSDPEAYQACLRGRYFWNRRTEEGLLKAITSFREATARDPDYAAALAGLADCFVLLPLYGGLAPREAFPEAIAAAGRALALDDSLADAHTSLAYARFFFGWDFPAAEAGFQRAMALNPGYSTAHHWYAFLLAARGRHEEAIAEARRALAADPVSLVINSDLGMVLCFARKTAEAVAQLERAVELDPSFPYAHFGLGHALQQAGRREEAAAAFGRAAALSPGSTTMRAALGQALARCGRRAEALAIRADLAAGATGRYVDAAHLAFLAVALDEPEEAMTQLSRACEERSRFVVFLESWSLYDPLRGRPGWRELLARIGLRGA